jgi:(S)-2-hydroxyglutarate dehydrogenase
MDGTFDYAVVGGGIVGLATAVALTERYPGTTLLLCEKEAAPAQHQTGHNSGVIHSGIYYKPGSLKARFAVEGRRLMVEFCKEHGIAFEVCGKVIVATEDAELPALQRLHERGIANGIPVRPIGRDEIRQYEPHCSGKSGLHVPTTGIADYKAVAREFARMIESRDGTLRFGCRVNGIARRDDATIVQTTQGDFSARFLINCGGLHSDRIARQAGAKPNARIVPFRGEYFELKHDRRHLVRNLIYPVPNPDFPFLGVHFTRMTDGNVHCGPNAVLALKREGYRKRDISLGDIFETLSYKGFWRLIAKNFGEGMKELHRSFSKSAFTKSLQRLVPEVEEEDLVPSAAGVRAQAIDPDGKMVDDFLIVAGPGALHVCNAPSPAATASIPIGREIAGRAPAPARRPLKMAS